MMQIFISWNNWQLWSHNKRVCHKLIPPSNKFENHGRLCPKRAANYPCGKFNGKFHVDVTVTAMRNDETDNVEHDLSINGDYLRCVATQRAVLVYLNVSFDRLSVSCKPVITVGDLLPENLFKLSFISKSVA